MMKQHILRGFTIALTFLSACGLKTKAQESFTPTATLSEDSSALLLSSRPDSLNLADYPKLKQSILQDKITLKHKSKAQAAQYFQQKLYTEVIPYWLGTPWDFNGYTAEPGKGEIACGYFVSTTLQHMGVKVNRYKLAQQYSHSIVRSLCLNDSVFYDKDALLQYLSQQSDDIWIVGLDNHVGYLFKHGKDIRFVHSTYVSPSCVCNEDAYASVVLSASTTYVIGQVLQQNDLIDKWLTDTEVLIKK